MGMLIRRHRDRHTTEDAPAEVGASKPLDRQNKDELQVTARALGLSDEGTKRELQARIREAEAARTAPEPVTPPADEDVEADKAPDTEPDQGAGGELVAPEGEGADPDAGDASDEDTEPDEGDASE